MLTTFLQTLAGGMLAVLATAQPTTIAPRFLRFAGLIVLAIVAVLLVDLVQFRGGGSRDVAIGVLGVVMAIAAIAAVLTVPGDNQLGGVFRWVCVGGGLSGLAAACLSVLGLRDLGDGSILGTVLLIVGQLSGALLLGSITIAWLLGHAYLTATKMTIAPLLHFSRMVLWAVIIRAGTACISLVAAWLVSDEFDSTIWLQLGNVWLIASVRIGCGLIVVGVFAYMVADCVRLRSTQSATGILYFASLLAYVGELANQQLVVECGWAL